MPPKLIVDELIEAFTDSRVIDAISAAMMLAIKLYIHEPLEEFNSKLKMIDAKQMAYKTAVKELGAKNVNLRYRLDTLEAESRLFSLIIRHS